MSLILVHLFCIIIMSIIIRSRGHLSFSKVILAALVPLFGPACLISGELLGKKAPAGGEMLSLNENTAEDAVYRSIRVRPDNDADSIVPLEESLLINHPAKRRRLLLNVLNLDPSDYVEGLRKAGINDDTEVVHYAVTALVELRKEFNDRLFHIEEEIKESQDLASLQRYAAFDEEYLKTGLPENGERLERLNHYNQLLAQLLEEDSSITDKASIDRKRAACFMAVRDYGKARHLLDRLIIKEPENEENYLLMLRCLSAMKDREGIDETLAALSANHVFLTKAGKEALAFWSSSSPQSA